MLTIYYFFFKLLIKISLSDILIRLFKIININIAEIVNTFKYVLINNKLSNVASELYRKLSEGKLSDKLKNKKLYRLKNLYFSFACKIASKLT